jgi:site-specific DNA recombinase
LVFQGGRKKFARRKRRIFATIRAEPIYQNKFFFGLNSRLGQFRLVLDWFRQGGFLSSRRGAVEKYFLYPRKSTDTEDKQVLSIEAQVAELRKYAQDNNFEIVDTIIEKRSAKSPGRPKFNKMIERIKNGEANGILAWHPDRLARNSIDGGQIIYLLDQNILQYLRFPMFQFDNTSQGKFMLSIMFGQSKYYVDNLSENVKRGLRQKLRRGEYPGKAPLGYYNDLRSKTIKIDKKTAPIVVEIYEMFAAGNYKITDIADFLAQNGIKKKNGRAFYWTRVKNILTNVFYYGHFAYGGEIHEGKHKPIISKRLFDQVQAVMEQRSNNTKAIIKQPKPFCGLLKCSCGMSVTAETKAKRQKNGNLNVWTYYHCTKKSKTERCLETPVRSELLDEQLSAILKEYQMPAWLADGIRGLIDKDERAEREQTDKVGANLKTKIAHLLDKQNILLDSYLNQDIDRDIFTAKKAEIMSKKKTLEEKWEQSLRGQNTWVEPMRNWLNKAVSICKIAESGDLIAKKSVLAEIFGSNLFLRNKKVVINDDKFLSPPLKNQWTALRAALAAPASRRGTSFVEGQVGLEPTTPCLKGRCSNQLSYWPIREVLIKKLNLSLTSGRAFFNYFFFTGSTGPCLAK